MKTNVKDLIMLSVKSLKDRYDDQERESAEWERVGVYDTKEKVMKRIMNDTEAIGELGEFHGYSMNDDGCGSVIVNYNDSDASLEFCYEILGDMEVNV